MKWILATIIVSMIFSLVAGLALAGETEIQLGTEIEIILLDRLDTKNSRHGATFRAFLNEPIVVINEGNEVIAPQGSAVQGRIVELRAGKFGGGLRAKRRAKIAVTLVAVEIQGEMVPITSTVNEFEITQNGDIAGRAVAGAAAGALGSRLVGSNQRMQATAAAVGAMLGMLGKAKQITLPAETEMQFLLAEPLTIMLPKKNQTLLSKKKQAAPTVEEEQGSFEEEQGSLDPIEPRIDSRPDVESLEESLEQLKKAAEQHSGQDALDLIAEISKLEIKLQVLMEIIGSDSRSFPENDAIKESLNDLEISIEEIQEKIKKWEDPPPLQRFKDSPFLSAFYFFAFLVGVALFIIDTKYVYQPMKAAQGQPWNVKQSAWKESMRRILSKHPILVISFGVLYSASLITGYYALEEPGWLLGGFLVLIIALTLPKFVVLLASGFNIVGD